MEVVRQRDRLVVLLEDKTANAIAAQIAACVYCPPSSLTPGMYFRKRPKQSAALRHKTCELAPAEGRMRLAPCLLRVTGRMAKYASISRSESQHCSDVLAAVLSAFNFSTSKCRQRAGPSSIPTWCLVNSTRSESTVNVRFSVPGICLSNR